MLSYRIENMTCGHCVGIITKALNRVDPEATVHIDLADRRVDIALEHSLPERFANAIRDAGYTPVEIAGTTGAVESAMPVRRSGCCCARMN